jgi:hypothetical protein
VNHSFVKKGPLKMEGKELKQKCLNLMETADAIYLSTVNGVDTHVYGGRKRP